MDSNDAIERLKQHTLQHADWAISRRTVLKWAGLTGVGLVGGSVTLLGCAQQPAGPAPQASPTALTGSTALYIFRGHSDVVWGVAWSPDDKRIASASGDHTVKVWDAATGGHIFTYRGHRDTVLAVAWSPDGRRISSGSADQTAQVWDAADGSQVFTYHGHADIVTCIAWSPDGRHIVSGGGTLIQYRDTTVQVWDAADGSQVFTYRGHPEPVFCVAWSPNGKRIASGGEDRTVQVWAAV